MTLWDKVCCPFISIHFNQLSHDQGDIMGLDKPLSTPGDRNVIFFSSFAEDDVK
jgi:hypothetical protein